MEHSIIFGELQKLENFGFSENPLLSGEIGIISNLIELNLDYYQLTGSTPTTVERLRNLPSLSLQGNKLERIHPDELYHLKILVISFLLDIYLVFQFIPSTLTRLADLLLLSLSSNSLSGAAPTDISKWKVIIGIDFSKNQLSGEISKSIGDLKDLTSLLLSSNRFQGSIPESLGAIIGLQVLDLSRNNFSGSIPKSVENHSYLDVFNVSFNRLEGKIPDKGCLANYSIRSFVGNKALCVAPPLQLPLPPCEVPSFVKHSRKAIQLVEYILLPGWLNDISIGSHCLFLTKTKKEGKSTNHIQENLKELAELRRVSYQELHHAIDGFSDSKLIGVGSFGSVYQGNLSDGLNIAVKIFNLELEGSFKSFDIECEFLRNILRRNLVKIISSCSNIDFKALVLEFMPSGSLEKWLYSHNHFLDILKRLNIMIDVASALEYLHHGYTTPVIHCDLKHSNVLDDDVVAHLGDFGISKLLGEEDSAIHTMTLATIGYGSEGIVCTKGDVYSFDILLMETTTRKKPIDEIFAGEMNLKYWVKVSLPSALMDVVDPNLLNNGERPYSTATSDCALSILQLALECSEEVLE
ncbi:hypothetical protein PTKIN_Ptkin14bG0116400 [Pterospermum kingtungense]